VPFPEDASGLVDEVTAGQSGFEVPLVVGAGVGDGGVRGDAGARAMADGSNASLTRE
jgi:hypothetical protein